MAMLSDVEDVTWTPIGLDDAFCRYRQLETLEIENHGLGDRYALDHGMGVSYQYVRAWPRLRNFAHFEEASGHVKASESSRLRDVACGAQQSLYNPVSMVGREQIMGCRPRVSD
jgi:hypothetical protein